MTTHLTLFAPEQKQGFLLCNKIISLLNMVMHETDCQGCLRAVLSRVGDVIRDG